MQEEGTLHFPDLGEVTIDQVQIKIKKWKKLSYIFDIFKVKKIDEDSYVPCSWHQKSNSPILEFKVLENAFEIKKQGLTYFLK